MPSFFDNNGWQSTGPTDKTAVTTAASAVKAIPGAKAGGQQAGNAQIENKLRAVLSNGTGAQRVYIEWGTTSTGTSAPAVSTATSMPLIVPSRELIRIPAGAQFYQVITDAGTADLHLTLGNGD